MAENQKIVIQDEEILTIVLPGGREMHIQLSDIDDDSSPEIDIWFDEDMTANCWQDGRVPAQPWDESPNVLTVRQIVIPVGRD